MAAVEDSRSPEEAKRIALVVDDVMVNRVLLGKMIGALGFEVIEATNGRHAVDTCRHVVPDVVFMDVMMPHVDGLMATREIKALPGRSCVPVIFVTAVSDEGLLHRCIEAGGDDFLVRPFSRTLLGAKVEVALRRRALHRDAVEQRDALSRYRLQHERGLEAAQRILDRLAARGGLDAANVRSALRPVETLSSDVLVAARRPGGQQCFLLGDFTGRGVPAALGALTAQDVFSAMIAKGRALSEVVIELNRKFCALLPVDRFLSAAIVEFEPATGDVQVWNAGMPEVVVRGAAGGIVTRCAATDLPLGILPHDYRASVQRVTLAPGEQLFVHSDGLVDGYGPHGDRYGSVRLQALLEAPGPAPALFDALLAAVEAHGEGEPQVDDATLLMLVHEPATVPRRGAD